MRWIEDALQKGRDYESGSDTLIPILSLKEAIKAHPPPNGSGIRRGMWAWQISQLTVLTSTLDNHIGVDACSLEAIE